jgi:hypothetical protein
MWMQNTRLVSSKLHKRKAAVESLYQLHRELSVNPAELCSVGIVLVPEDIYTFDGQLPTSQVLHP